MPTKIYEFEAPKRYILFSTLFWNDSNWNKEDYILNDDEVEHFKSLGIDPGKDESKSFNKALIFAKDYYNSPGFKQRLQAHNINPLRKGKRFSQTKEYVTPNFNFDYSNGTHFDISSRTLKVNPEEYDKTIELTGIPTNEYIFNHEITGHGIDYLMNSLGDYSESYDIFRKNKDLQKYINDDVYKDYIQQFFPEDYELLKTNPNKISFGFYNLVAHDAIPKESYADLATLRAMLYRSGIYDSMEANNPFTKEHLKQAKKLVPDFRLFRLFDDDDIVTMMNTVADNGQLNNQYNDVSYAKKGVKLIPKKKRYL